MIVLYLFFQKYKIVFGAERRKHNISPYKINIFCGGTEQKISDYPLYNKKKKTYFTSFLKGKSSLRKNLIIKKIYFI